MTYPYSPQGMAELGRGDHIGCFYRSESEYRWAFTALVGWGLQRGEKILCVIEEHAPATLLDYLQAGGLNVIAALQSGALVIHSISQLPAPQARTDPGWLLPWLRQEVYQAQAQGYPLLRCLIEMSWLAPDRHNLQSWLAYEERLNNVCPDCQVLIACLYNLARFDRQQLVTILRQHPLTTVGTELYDHFEYVPQAELLGTELLRDPSESSTIGFPLPPPHRQGIIPPTVESDIRLYSP